jgi:hypothetical protein
MFCEMVANAEDVANSALTPRLNDPIRLLIDVPFSS